jgi:predicted alpha/beta-hydrolase family hydrolase
MLFVQGSRDLFGTAEEIREVLPRLNPRAQLFEVPDGDHSFKIRVSIAGKPQGVVMTEIFDRVAAFIRSGGRS